MNKLALFSVPRSGSSWLGELLNSSPEVIYKFQPNFAYSFDSQLTEHSSTEEIAQFYEKLLACEDDFVNGKLSISGKRKDLGFFKTAPTTLLFKETHFLNVIENLLQNSATKVIGLIRSPFAVISSWLRIPKEFDPKWSTEDQWYYASKKNQDKASHYFGYDKWKEAAFLFLALQKKYPEQFYLINYDDLILDTRLEIERLFNFSNIAMNDQTLAFIKRSTRESSHDDYAVFRSKRNDLRWKEHLPSFIFNHIINDHEFMKINKIFKWNY